MHGRSCFKDCFLARTCGYNARRLAVKAHGSPFACFLACLFCSFFGYLFVRWLGCLFTLTLASAQSGSVSFSHSKLIALTQEINGCANHGEKPIKQGPVYRPAFQARFLTPSLAEVLFSGPFSGTMFSPVFPQFSTVKGRIKAPSRPEICPGKAGHALIC